MDVREREIDMLHVWMLGIKTLCLSACLCIYNCITLCLSEQESVSEREGEIEMCVWSVVCVHVCVCVVRVWCACMFVCVRLHLSVEHTFSGVHVPFYLLARQVSVTICDLDLCCCVHNFS